MTGFFFRHVPLKHSQITGLGLRAMRVRLAKARRVNRRVKLSLEALQIAAAEIEVLNWKIGGENELTFLYNTLADKWVHDRLVELENDPLVRKAFERFNAQNLDGKDIINVKQAQPPRNGGASGGASGDSRE